MYKSSLIITPILFTLLISCGPSTSERIEANKKLIHRFTEVINSAEWDGLDELLTDDFTRHCQATPDVQVNSREEFKELQESFLISMPERACAGMP